MKIRNIYLWVILGCVFSHCTPKTTETLVKEDFMVNDDSMTNKGADASSDPLAWRATAPSPGEARKIQMGTYNTFMLDNGLQVIVVQNGKVPKVSYSISLKHDPINEGDQIGYVSIAGDLISRGTTTKTKAEIDESIDFLGASFSTSSGGIFASSLKKHGPELLGIVSDVLMNPIFSPEEFDKVKNQILSGIQSEKSDPSSMASNVSQVLDYGKDHPYGEIQTEETINAVQLENCKKYYQDYFKPNNAYLTIVGDINLEDAKANANKYFGAWKKGDVTSTEYVTPKPPEGAQVAFVNKDGAVQSVINVTYPIDLKPNTKESIAASLTNSILGGGIFLGRLMQNLREDKAYTYGARSRLNSDDLVGSFTAFASVRNEVTDSSVTEILYEMDRIATEKVSEEDLQLAKNSAAGSFARSLESPQTLARFARNIVKYNLPEDYYETYLEKLEAITVSDIQTMAAKYIRPNNAHILVVGNKDEVADKLLPFDADGVIDYYDAFGNSVEISDTPISEDITPSSIIDDYLNAIGGKDKLKQVNSIEQHFAMSVMGQDAMIRTFKVNKEKLAVIVEMAGQVMQSQKYDGTKGQMSGMGQNQIFEEGDELDDMKSQTTIFDQLDYSGVDYKLDLKGIEKVDGKDCYKLLVTNPVGKKTTEFYAKDSKLLVKTVTTEGEKAIIVVSSDYEEVDGIMFPKKITTEGAMPVPLVMIEKKTTINPELDAATFTIE